MIDRAAEGWKSALRFVLVCAAAASIPAGSWPALAEEAAFHCIGVTTLSYPALPNFSSVGDIVHVVVTLGEGPTLGGTHMTVSRYRFDLDCDGADDASCQDDGPVISYQGNLSTTCGVTFTSSHAVGAVTPNQIVFTPEPPVVIPLNTPEFCTFEFDVKIETSSHDSTPLLIEEISGFDAAAGDALCDTFPPLPSAMTALGVIRLCPTCADDGDQCNGIEMCDQNAGPDGSPCVSADPLSCDDANVCTKDSCDPGVPYPASPCIHNETHGAGCGSELDRCLACSPEANGAVLICHKPRTGDAPARTLGVPPAALPRHCRNHGDSCGPCAVSRSAPRLGVHP